MSLTIIYSTSIHNVLEYHTYISHLHSHTETPDIFKANRPEKEPRYSNFIEIEEFNGENLFYSDVSILKK